MGVGRGALTPTYTMRLEVAQHMSHDTTETPKKRCTKCGKEFPATPEYFHREKGCSDGLRPDCKICRSTQGAAHRLAHLNEHRQRAALYYADHRNAILARRATYRANHRKEKAEYDAIYYAAHREEQIKRSATYRATHQKEIVASREARREKIAAQHAVYRASHRKELAEKAALYHQTERGKQAQRAAHQNRRSRKQAAGQKLSATDLALVLKAHTDNKNRLRCARCGRVIKNGYHLDHFIPLKEGGDNSPGNYRVMHPHCNLKKSANHPHKIGMLI